MHKRKTPAPEMVPTMLVPQLLTIDQAAAALNVGRSSVYDLINDEGLPYVLIKGAKRIPVASLHWWIAQRECSTLGVRNDHLRRKAGEVSGKELTPEEMPHTHKTTKSIRSRKTSKA